MASMRDIKSRIIATKKTAQITNAMYMVSASKLKKAERAMVSYRPMVKRLNHIIQGLLTDDDISHVFLEKRPVKKVCYILISSDRGLAGPYNANLFRKFQSHLKESNVDPSTVMVAAIGQKAFSFAKRNQYQLVNDKPIHVRDDIQFVDFKEITQKFIDLFLSKQVDEIVVFYSHFINTLYQNAESKTLLPVRLEETDEPQKTRYEYEPNKVEIINHLLPMVVENTLYGFILEAKAGEHASRMTAMRSATDNAKDVIKKLELHYNRARQAAITIELTDIIGGANAVK
ncbi:ATP synthase F1 subunit gamma [Acholeplasma vituli]|uniref:ATP synthase gamma chain n=1 Tax=Paracholeplasma vituli TaxID=69473 RepID=A0ABT2PU41_9MOLU|nr:ATP synthase F1 subunit gamma [Paracholeplasma vituli]MCU0104473.1 ATP synthase F1 subunit gamma [Paracholeplasma vituli]